jgi:hypothetical protein
MNPVQPGERRLYGWRRSAPHRFVRRADIEQLRVHRIDDPEDLADVLDDLAEPLLTRAQVPLRLLPLQLALVNLARKRHVHRQFVEQAQFVLIEKPGFLRVEIERPDHAAARPQRKRRHRPVAAGKGGLPPRQRPGIAGNVVAHAVLAFAQRVRGEHAAARRIRSNQTRQDLERLRIRAGMRDKTQRLVIRSAARSTPGRTRPFRPPPGTR